MNASQSAAPFSVLWARCLTCNGSGIVPVAGSYLATPCNICDGEGRIYLAWPPRTHKHGVVNMEPQA